jgi:hypothetical protein
MGRAIAGVIVGYIVLFVVMFCVLTVAYLAMGADLAFKPASFEPSALWLLVQIVVGFLAGAVAGWVCMAIAAKRGAVIALVVVILVIGFASAIPVVMKAGAPQAVREGGLSNMQAMMQARPPVWMAFFDPILGAVGAWFGSRFKRA